MDVALVVAIFRSLVLERVEHALQGMGVRGITVSRVKVYGEYANLFAANHKIEQVKVEVLVERERAGAIQGIFDTMHTEMPGDGLVAILPMEKTFSGRTRGGNLPQPATHINDVTLLAAVLRTETRVLAGAGAKCWVDEETVKETRTWNG